MEEFKLDDFTEEADNEDEGESQSSQINDTVSVSEILLMIFISLIENLPQFHDCNCCIPVIFDCFKVIFLPQYDEQNLPM